jgi:regulator of protease activity HflC (stomatin/prohibitin superfamily)
MAIDGPAYQEEENGSESGRGEALFKSFLSRLPKPQLSPPDFPGRRLVLAGAFLLALLLAYLFARGGVRAVEPGSVGIAVNRLTGTLQALSPGTYFRPGALYEIHPVRVSDRLLSGPHGSFNVSTRDGVVARVAVQARWAVDRGKLLSKWAALPPDPERELVAPVLAAAFRSVAPRYEAVQIVSEKREELALVSARQARERLSESGIVLKEVLVGDLVLPPEFERGRVALVDEVQNTERMEVTLRLKAKEVEKSRLEAEARKQQQVKQAEAIAAQRLIAARAEADAMKFILALKQKEIEQKKLEAEADRQSRVKRAEADAAVTRIHAGAEAERRKTIADAEAYAIRSTSLAQFESLEREAALVTANPLLIPKTFADRLSDKVQVILTPTMGGEAFTDEVLRRAANGEMPVASPAPAPATKQARNRPASRVQ